MELQGKVIAMMPAKSGVNAQGKEWKAQEFVIEYQEGQYPRHMVFSVFGADRLEKFNLAVGQQIKVSFDIDAREWNGRWFTDIKAYAVEQIGVTPEIAAQAAESQAGATVVQPEVEKPSEAAKTAENEPELPF